MASYPTPPSLHSQNRNYFSPSFQRASLNYAAFYRKENEPRELVACYSRIWGGGGVVPLKGSCEKCRCREALHLWNTSLSYWFSRKNWDFHPGFPTCCRGVGGAQISPLSFLGLSSVHFKGYSNYCPISLSYDKDLPSSPHQKKKSQWKSSLNCRMQFSYDFVLIICWALIL